MSEAQFDRLVDELRSLGLEEQKRLHRLLDAWLAPVEQHQSAEAGAEYRFEQALLKEGILSKLPHGGIPRRQKRFGPVESLSGSVSEIIIEERR